MGLSSAKWIETSVFCPFCYYYFLNTVQFSMPNKKELKHSLRFFLSMGCSRLCQSCSRPLLTLGSFLGTFQLTRYIGRCGRRVHLVPSSHQPVASFALETQAWAESGNLGPFHFLALSQSWFERIPPNILWLESGLWMECPGSDLELCLVSSALAASFHSPEHFYPVYPNNKIWN